MELTKYVPEKPPSKDVIRYLDAEVRKIQRSLDSVLAWKKLLETIPAEQQYLVAQRFIAERSTGSGVAGVPVPHDFFHAINTVGGTGRVAGIDFQIGYPTPTWQTAIWAEQGNWWHAFGPNDYVAHWGYDGVRIRNSAARGGVWTAPTFQNSWTDLGGGWVQAGYYKTPDGFAHIRGVIQSGTLTQGTVLFNVPADFRPNANHTFVANTHTGAAETQCRIDVHTGGNVILQETLAGGTLYIGFNNIHYYVG